MDNQPMSIDDRQPDLTAQGGTDHSIREEQRMTFEPFTKKVNRIKEAFKKAGLNATVEATNGAIRLVTSGNGEVIVTNTAFRNIEHELNAGEWALHISMKFKKHGDKDKFLTALNTVFDADQWVDRNQDDEKVDITFIYTGDGMRTEFETFFTTEDPTGYKRKRALWHRSPTFGKWEHVVVLRKGDTMPEVRAANTIYIQMFSGNPGKYDGDFIINASLLDEMFGVEEDCVTYDTVRGSFNLDGVPVHIKGDALIAYIYGGADIYINTENVKFNEFGFLPGIEGFIMTMNPKAQYKTAFTNPQFDSSFGGHLMGQEHPGYDGLTYYDVMTQKDMGYKLSQTILGRNKWAGFDLDDKRAANTQALEYKEVAEKICDSMGSILGIPSLVIKAVEMLRLQINSPKASRGGKDIRARIPHARWASMRSTVMLEATNRPAPEGNTVALSKWGAHFPDEIREAVKEVLGGADFDDLSKLILVRVAKDFSWMGYEFKADQLAFLILRSPTGIRAHNGKVAVEYWMSHINEDEYTMRHLRRYFNVTGDDIMTLDPDMLPPCVLELPEPEVTEPTTAATLPFMEQVEQSYELQGTYDKLANGMSLVAHLASFNGFQLHTPFTIDYSSEFMIDVCTKTFGAADLAALEALVAKFNKATMEEIKHIGSVGKAFAIRTGQADKIKVDTTGEWLFDRQINIYKEAAAVTKELLDLFEISYRTGWGHMSPSGNYRSQATTPSALVYALIDKVLEALREVSSDTRRITTHEYLMAYTRVTEEVAEKLEDRHIHELFISQGNITTWSTGKDTNYVGHVLFNSRMVDRTLEALDTMETDWYQELLNTGIYDTVLSELDDEETPFERELVDQFLRLTTVKQDTWEEDVMAVVDKFGGIIDTEVMEDVEETLSEDDSDYDNMAWTDYIGE